MIHHLISFSTDMAETWQVDEVTAAADWWSVGALLYEMITGQVSDLLCLLKLCG